MPGDRHRSVIDVTQLRAEFGEEFVLLTGDPQHDYHAIWHGIEMPKPVPPQVDRAELLHPETKAGTAVALEMTTDVSKLTEGCLRPLATQMVPVGNSPDLLPVGNNPSRRVDVARQGPMGPKVSEAPRTRVVDAAAAFLREALAAGPLEAAVLVERAKDAGIGERTLRQAKAASGIKSAKQGCKWVWALQPCSLAALEGGQP